MRRSLWMLGLLAAWASAASAGPLVADATTTGTTVLWFSGPRVTTEFDGQLDLLAEADLFGTAISFAGSGRAFGAGIADTATLAAEIWSLFAVRGTTETGDEVSFVGGMSIASTDADLTGSSIGSGAGAFLARLLAPGVDAIVRGTVSGTASGAFVPPAIPTTMQIVGTGTFSFVGDAAAATDPDALARLAPEDLPWDATGWPSELLGRLFRLLIDGRPAEPSG